MGKGKEQSLEGNSIMDDLLQRITFDQNVLRGKPVIRGLRISVEMILELLAKGATWEEILEDYPQLGLMICVPPCSMPTIWLLER